MFLSSHPGVRALCRHDEPKAARAPLMPRTAEELGRNGTPLLHFPRIPRPKPVQQNHPTPYLKWSAGESRLFGSPCDPPRVDRVFIMGSNLCGNSPLSQTGLQNLCGMQGHPRYERKAQRDTMGDDGQCCSAVACGASPFIVGSSHQDGEKAGVDS